MTDIIRINRTQSFKIVKTERASEVGSKFELDSSYRNCYYLFEDDTTSEPRQVREDRFYLKGQKSRMVYLMTLQTTDTKLIKKRKIKNDKHEPKQDVSELDTVVD